FHGLWRGHGAGARGGALRRPVHPHGGLGGRLAPGGHGRAFSVHPVPDADAVREFLRKLSRHLRARGSGATRLALCALRNSRGTEGLDRIALPLASLMACSSCAKFPTTTRRSRTGRSCFACSG